MVKKYYLSKEQALYAVRHGEFAPGIAGACSNVVVIMTQDWCPQWHRMEEWLDSVEAVEETMIFVLTYNNTDFGEDFARFKENEFNNGQIPYLRFYRKGKLIRETNYVGRHIFEEILGEETIYSSFALGEKNEYGLKDRRGSDENC